MMLVSGMGALDKWDSFYVIVGSAAGALIGLQFVVMTLLADRPRSVEAGATFATPTIVHFSTVLFLSALLRAPWDSVTSVAAICGLAGLGGVAYAVLIAVRMRSQTSYNPDYEDVLFHAVLPLAAYAMLAVSGYATLFQIHQALFAVAGATLLLLFAGIHNAWDATTYQVLVNRPKEERDKQGQP